MKNNTAKTYITISDAVKVLKGLGFDMSIVTVRKLVRDNKLAVQSGKWRKMYIDKSKFDKFVESFVSSMEA